MRIEELDYDLPLELIAQQPVEPRDASRLLVLHRASGAIQHRSFRDIREYMRPGDLLVVNDTRVVPARFFARRESGGRVEGLFLHLEHSSPSVADSVAPPAELWRVMLKPSARLRVGERLMLDGSPAALIIQARHVRGEWSVACDPPSPAFALLAQIGITPLPPYIHRVQPKPGATGGDVERYQTVYAAQPGAVAAPTAGLHFTPELIAKLEADGVRRAAVTLHVGPGTFLPIDAEELAEHRMHAEWYSVPADAAAAIAQTRAAGGRIVAVGTTAARVLETIGRADGAPRSGWTNIFIYPPYEFRLVDMLITNFHLPRSTLLAMLMALAGRDPIRAAYTAAIAERYRFYSYGDAKLIV